MIYLKHFSSKEKIMERNLKVILTKKQINEYNQLLLKNKQMKFLFRIIKKKTLAIDS